MLKLFFSFLCVGLLIHFLGQFNLFWYLTLLVLCFIEGVFIKMCFFKTNETKSKAKESSTGLVFLALIIFGIYYIIRVDYSETGFLISYFFSLFLGFNLYSDKTSNEDNTTT